MSEFRDKDTTNKEGVGGGIGRIFGGRQTFRSFKNPVFRLYFVAMAGYMAPMNMQLVGRSLLVYRITGSAAILGVMSLAFAIPMVCLSLFGGVIADRVSKKNIIVAGTMGSALVSLGIALALTLGYLGTESPGSWWILVVAGAIQGTIMALMIPSRLAIIPEIVGREELLNAVSLNTMEMSGLRMLAPALAGFLVESFGFDTLYYVMTGCYLMGAVIFSFLPRTGRAVTPGPNALTQMKEGLNYVRHNTTILYILFFTIFAVVLTMPFYLLMPIFTEDILMVGAAGLGILMSVSGAGAIIGSLVLASLPNKKRGLMFLMGNLVMSLAVVGFSFFGSWHPSLALIAIVGLGDTARMTLGNTLLQYYTEEEYRGRVMSIFVMQFGLMGFGAFGAGLLTEVVGVQWAVGGLAAVLIPVSLLVIAFVPRLRRLD
jgi:MFS family permease